MRVQIVDGQVVIVLENTGDIAKILLVISHSSKSELIPTRVFEALEDEVSE